MLGLLHEPIAQRFRPMEREGPATPRFWIQQVRESGFFPGALIQERQWSPRSWETLRQAFAVLCRLEFNVREGLAFFLGFDNTCGGSINVEHVVSEPET